MKRLIVFSLVLLAISSCQKEIHPPPQNDDFVNRIYQDLRDSLQPATFAQLDWQRIAPRHP